MIHELNPAGYEKVRPLFRGLEWNLITTAVMESMCPGTIYVDDTDTPTASLIVSNEGYYLAGRETDARFNDELLELLDTTIIPKKMGEGEENISLNYHPSGWGAVLGRMLAERYPLEVHGYYYAFEKTRIDWRRGIPPGFSMRIIDEGFLRENHLENMKEIREWIGRTWISEEMFLSHGGGCCLVCGDTIASYCLTDCAVGAKCEIGIETDERYRRRGLATLAVAATVDLLRSRGKTDIGWHTGPTNVASMRTAERAGFAKVLRDTYLFFFFYPIDNFIEHGYLSSTEGRFRESAEWYERAIAQIEGEGVPRSFQYPKNHSLAALYYYAACSWAQAGESGSSLRNLEKAEPVARDRKRFLGLLEASGSLESLRGTEEWNRLLDSLRG